MSLITIASPAKIYFNTLNQTKSVQELAYLRAMMRDPRALRYNVAASQSAQKNVRRYLRRESSP